MAASISIKDELGLVQIYTGNGKGKTTAQLGLAIRAAGRGLNVLCLQFLKPPAASGEYLSLIKFDNITMYSMGLDHFVNDKPSDDDIENAHDTLEKQEELISSNKYDVVILDEAMNAVRLNLITSKELIETLDKRPKHVEIILTGRGMTPELEEYADLITEMKLVKHPVDKGVGARMGIEY